MDRGAWRAAVHGVAESDATEQLTHTAWLYQIALPLFPRKLSFTFCLWS